jgi:type II secretory pathway pseudopilin PulG
MRTVTLVSIRSERRQEAEEGFMLVGLIVAIFLILLVLGVAAPKVSQALKRDREVEAVHRGDQYVRAIRLFYRKTHTYPGSIEQLEKTNNIRFLRQRYVDPMTGKDDWRLIHVGEAKTTVKGFFGQPLTGMAPGLGSAANLASGGGIGTGAAGSGQQAGSSSTFGGSAFGGSSSGGYSSGAGGLGGSTMPTLGGSSSSGTPTLGGSTSSSGTPTLGGSTGSSGTPTLGGSSSDSSSTPGQSNGLGSASGLQSSGTSSGGAPFVGVGIPKDGASITVLNEQTTYDTWEFLYDPRIEQLYAKGSLFGGSGSLGSASGNSSGGFGNTPGSGTTPGGFGNTPGGFGASPGTPSPTTPTTPQPPQ